mmetsp:Transcript_20700/g.44855  ORF Transcript_20700/g.44855 Transcript_20700/m.44855 type:complete len:108 (-) Transcript_20700:22-345(-)
MFEIDNKPRREKFLRSIVGAEEKLSLIFDGRVVQGRPMIDDDVDRSGADRADGKASAVQFLDFTLTPDQVNEFKQAGTVFLSIDHPAYAHTTQLKAPLVTALQQELD